jgi:hypothetical protein
MRAAAVCRALGEVLGVPNYRYLPNTIPDPNIEQAPHSNNFDFFTQFWINHHKILYTSSSTSYKCTQYFFLMRNLPWGERKESVVYHTCQPMPCWSFYVIENDKVAILTIKTKKASSEFLHLITDTSIQALY